MRIGVFSDSHGNSQMLLLAAARLGEVNAVIHLGDYYRDLAILQQHYDCPAYCVRGNCDYAAEAPGELELVFYGKRFFIVHGHAQGVKSGTARLVEQASARGAHIALFGHTHIALLASSGKLLLLNPGSVTKPLRGGPSCALITIDETGIRPQIIKV